LNRLSALFNRLSSDKFTLLDHVECVTQVTLTYNVIHHTWRITYSPAFNLSSLMPSHTWMRSYGSMEDNRSIPVKTCSYLSLLLNGDIYGIKYFTAASLTILLKVARSKANSTASVLALMDAALGALYSKANSPNDSPGMYVYDRYIEMIPLETWALHPCRTSCNNPIHLDPRRTSCLHPHPTRWSSYQD
jgi:hypothetical protein